MNDSTRHSGSFLHVLDYVDKFLSACDVVCGEANACVLGLNSTAAPSLANPMNDSAHHFGSFLHVLASASR